MESTPLHMKNWRSLALSAGQIADHLERTPWANELDYAELMTLSEYFESFEIASGTPVMEQFAREQFACIIVDGTFGVYVGKEGEPSHGEQEVGRFSKGKVVGEISLFEGGPRSATVRALTPGVILVLDIDNMNQMAEQQPKLAFILCRRILREVSARLRQTTSRVFQH